jgi:hypothetical protein
VLTLTFGTCTLAGIIETPPAPAPPPAAPSTTATATGTIDTPPSDAQPVAAPSDLVVDIALNLLQSVLLAF